MLSFQRFDVQSRSTPKTVLFGCVQLPELCCREVFASRESHGGRILEVWLWITTASPLFRKCTPNNYIRIRPVSDIIIRAILKHQFREPDIFRLALAPLYNTYHEGWRFVQILRDVIAETAS